MTQGTKHAPSSTRIILAGLLSIACLVLGFGGWASFTRIDGAVIAAGRFGSDTYRKPVEHRDGGLVAELLVSEGQTVDAGQVLVRLDGKRLQTELALLQSQMIELAARRARLEAERDGNSVIHFPLGTQQPGSPQDQIAEIRAGQQQLFEAGLQALQQEIAQLQKRQAQARAHLEGVAQQEAALITQRDLVQAELARQQTLLDRNLVPERSVLNLKREVARLAEEMGRLASLKADTAGLITSLELEALKRHTKRRETAISQLRDVAQRLLELGEREKAALAEISALDVRAPIAGTVFALTVSAPQEVIRRDEPILYVVPQTNDGRVTALLDPVHVDQVSPGQRVRMQVLAFDTRETTDIWGRVASISADVFPQKNSNRAYYHVTVETDLDASDLSLKDMKPGLPVDVYILTGGRAPIAYLTEPLTDYFRRAFRES